MVGGATISVSKHGAIKTDRQTERVHCHTDRQAEGWDGRRRWITISKHTVTLKTDRQMER